MIGEFFAQIDFDQNIGNGDKTISEHGSLLVAMSNLMTLFGKGKPIDPASLNDHFYQFGLYKQTDGTVHDRLKWDTLTEYDNHIKVAHHDFGWPTKPNAIVRFNFQSKEKPFIKAPDGEKIPNMIDHFCVISDTEKQLIIDSFDGEIKPGLPYGAPVSYVVYEYIENPEELKPKREIQYELLTKPLPMHVNKDNGTRKWSFGNIKNWEDFTASGFYPKHTNVTVVAVAHVPVGEDTAAYYMEAKDYNATPRRTVGYAWSDLTEGFMVAQKPAPIAKQPLSQNVVTDIKFEKKIEKINKKADDPEQNHDLWKTSYQKLEKPESVTADLPDGQEVITIKDYDGHRPDKNMPWDWEGYIAGTFVVDDVLYGRPLGSTLNLKEDPNWTPNWYGIPMDCLTANKDLYTDTIDHRLTLAERKLWAPVFKRAVRVSERYTNLKNKKTK